MSETARAPVRPCPGKENVVREILSPLFSRESRRRRSSPGICLSLSLAQGRGPVLPLSEKRRPGGEMHFSCSGSSRTLSLFRLRVAVLPGSTVFVRSINGFNDPARNRAESRRVEKMLSRDRKAVRRIRKTSGFFPLFPECSGGGERPVQKDHRRPGHIAGSRTGRFPLFSNERNLKESGS